jgi:hypothetical protein
MAALPRASPRPTEVEPSVTNYTSLRIPLGQLPTGANTFAIQFVCFLPAALCSTPNFLFGASPALMFSY